MTAVFPQAPLDLEFGIQLTGGSWTDITSKCYQRDGTAPAATIIRGRPDGSSQASPSSMTMQINNRDGRFTAGNPTGPYYGQMGKNTPIRASVPAQATYLRMEGDDQSLASCPGGAGLAISGNLDVRIDLAVSGYPAIRSGFEWQVYDTTPGYTGLWNLDYWAAALISQWTTSGSQRSWALLLQPDGTLLLAWSPDGTFASARFAASTMPVPQGAGCVRATLTASTGAVEFWTSATGNAHTGPWTQLGALAGGAGATSVLATSTAAVRVGYNSGMNSDQATTYGGNVTGMTGAVYEAEVRNGISGTVVAHPVFTTQTAGSSSFADAQGNTWSMTGTAELSGRSYRFHGEMASAPKQQDPSGTDIWVPYQCGGILRRISQGNSPVASPMTRALLTQSGSLACVALWPCEDLAGATSIGSAIGGPLMNIAGSPQMASDSSFTGASALPVLNGSTWYGAVPAYDSTGAIILRFLMKVSTGPASSARIIRLITTGTASEISLYYGSGGGLGLAGFNAGGTVFDTGSVAFAVNGQQLWVSVELQPSGSNVDYSITTLVPGAVTGVSFSGSFAGTVGNATSVIPNPYGQCGQVTLGMISVQSAWETLFRFSSPLNGWTGETAGNRFSRLCAENGIAARVYGPPLTTAAMGAQPVDTLPNLLQACEDADRGMIFEPRSSYALGYRTLVSLLNQAPAVTLDWTILKQLAWQGWQPPVDDDQYTLNDWTLSRTSGSTASSGATYRAYLDDGSAMSVSPPPAGAGDYATSGSVNVESDTQLPDLAGWLVHMFTVSGDRYPAIAADLSRAAMAGVFWQVQELSIGDYIAVQNAPTWLTYDLIRQVAAGVTEELGGVFFRLVFNSIPESPYETGIFDDPVYGRADTDGSQLAGPVSTTATTLLVINNDSALPLWTIAAADFPFDIQVTGERMTVTNITGSTPGSDQVFTVTRSVNGVVKSHITGEDVRLFTPPVYAIA